MSKEELKAILAQGQVAKVIKALLTRTAGGEYHNEVIQQSAQFKTYERNKRIGISSEDAQRQSLSQVSDSLLQIIDKLEHNPENELAASMKKLDIVWSKYLGRMGLLIGILAGIVSTLKHLGYIGGPPATESRSITVLVHGADGKGDIVLPNRGTVYLIYGDAKIPEQINNEGEATFKQIDGRFFEENASVEFLFEDPEGEPYRLRYPDSTYQLEASQYIALEALLEGQEQLEGTVKDFVTGEPIDSVHIRIRGNSYYTNAFGEFTLDIPEDRQAQFIDMRLSKVGYEAKELQNVPTTTDQAQTISLKPLR